jgi:hypothetical protein
MTSPHPFTTRSTTTMSTSLNRLNDAEQLARRLIQLTAAAERLAEVDDALERSLRSEELATTVSFALGYGATVAEVAAAITAGAQEVAK